MFRRFRERKGLAKLLQAVRDPQKVRAMLKETPTDRARLLRSLLNVAARVSRLYRQETAQIPEPPNGLQSGRTRLMATVDELRIAKHRRYRTQARWAMRFAGAVIAAVILIVPTGVYALRASNQSLPGHVLYPLKHSQESYMLRRTEGQPSAHVALSLTFTDERIREMQALTRKGRPIPKGVVARVDALTRQAVEAAAWSPEPMMETHLRVIAWYNQTHIHALETLKAETSTETQSVLNSAQTVIANQYRITEAAMESPDVFRAAYQTGEPEKLATPGGGPLDTPEPTRVIDDILKQPTTPAPTDLPVLRTDNPTPDPSASPEVPATPDPKVPATEEPEAPEGPPQDKPGGPVDPADPADPADPNPETPPGQDAKPEEPPGQGEDPPGEGENPPGQGEEPPGQDEKAPDQNDDPPDQDGKDRDKGQP